MNLTTNEISSSNSNKLKFADQLLFGTGEIAFSTLDEVVAVVRFLSTIQGAPNLTVKLLSREALGTKIVADMIVLNNRVELIKGRADVVV